MSSFFLVLDNSWFLQDGIPTIEEATEEFFKKIINKAFISECAEEDSYTKETVEHQNFHLVKVTVVDNEQSHAEFVKNITKSVRAHRHKLAALTSTKPKTETKVWSIIDGNAERLR